MDPDPPMEFRLRGKDSWTKKYWYGFQNLRYLKNKVELDMLETFEKGMSLSKYNAGPLIIRDPEAE